MKNIFNLKTAQREEIDPRDRTNLGLDREENNWKLYDQILNEYKPTIQNTLKMVNDWMQDLEKLNSLVYSGHHKSNDPQFQKLALELI